MNRTERYLQLRNTYGFGETEAMIFVMEEEELHGKKKPKKSRLGKYIVYLGRSISNHYSYILIYIRTKLDMMIHMLKKILQKITGLKSPKIYGALFSGDCWWTPLFYFTGGVLPINNNRRALTIENNPVLALLKSRLTSK
jgi:hypothetical protein